jgi:hypothetical protein
MIIVPAEQATPAPLPANPPASTSTGRSTLQVSPSFDGESSSAVADRTVWVGSFGTEDFVLEAR